MDNVNIDDPGNRARELETLGRNAAEEVAGAGSVLDVRVVPDVDAFDQLTYDFIFLMDQDRITQRLGFVRSRITQKLRDALAAQNDPHYAMIKMLDRTDWDKHIGA